MFRIGHGYDAHRFTEVNAGKPLILGGVTIPWERGLIAHSDGDAVIHALCDAILGALALGDIGHHFPDSDQKLAGMNSAVFLREIVVMMRARHWRLGNADITILAQAPKMAPYIHDMRQHLAQLLQVEEEQINVKASTTEGMGFVGRKEGLEAYAVVLLERTGNDA